MHTTLIHSRSISSVSQNQFSIDTTMPYVYGHSLIIPKTSEQLTPYYMLKYGSNGQRELCVTYYTSGAVLTYGTPVFIDNIDSRVKVNYTERSKTKIDKRIGLLAQATQLEDLYIVVTNPITFEGCNMPFTYDYITTSLTPMTRRSYGGDTEYELKFKYEYTQPSKLPKLDNLDFVTTEADENWLEVPLNTNETELDYIVNILGNSRFDPHIVIDNKNIKLFISQTTGVLNHVKLFLIKLIDVIRADIHYWNII